jgi:glycerol kinase
MNPLVLAIDVGTHAARAAIVDVAAGQIHLSCSEDIGLNRIDAARVEQDPQEILSATLAAVAQVMAKAADKELVPAKAAVVTQRSTVVAWNRETGEALTPALSWQDTRAADQVAALAENRLDIKRRSGLVLSPHYGASKMRWMLTEYGAAWQPISVCISPLVSYLLFHLLDGKPCVCDESNAGRSQLWNLQARQWDPVLCDYFAVPQAYLPELLPIQANYGRLAEHGVPVTAVAGDQNAAFNAFASGSGSGTGDCALVNIGSGAFVLSPYAGTHAPSDDLLVSLYRSNDRTFDLLLEGTVNGAGTALDWCYNDWRRSQSESPEVAADALTREKFYRALPIWLANTPKPPLFFNCIGGLGSPFWRQGLSPYFSDPAADLPARAAAVVESIVFLVFANIRLMQPLQPNLKELLVTGGVAQLDGLCQKLANLAGVPVVRPKESEATVLGAAVLASGWTLAGAVEPQRIFAPEADTFLHGRFKDFLIFLNA